MPSFAFIPDTNETSIALATAFAAALQTRQTSAAVISPAVPDTNYRYDYRVRLDMATDADDSVSGFAIQAPAESRVVTVLSFILARFGLTPVAYNRGIIDPLNGFIQSGYDALPQNDVFVQIGYSTSAADLALYDTYTDLIAEAFAYLYTNYDYPLQLGVLVKANADPWFLSLGAWDEDAASKAEGDSGQIKVTTYDGIPLRVLELSAVAAKEDPYLWSTPLAAYFEGNACGVFLARRKPGVSDETVVRAAFGAASDDFTLTSSWAVYNFVGVLSAPSEATIGILSGSAQVAGYVVLRGLDSVELLTQAARYTPYSPADFTLFGRLRRPASATTSSPSASSGPFSPSVLEGAFGNLSASTSIFSGMLGGATQIFTVLDPANFVNMKTSSLSAALPNMTDINMRMKTQEMIQTIGTVVRTAQKYTEGPVIRSLETDKVKEKSKEIETMVSDKIKEFSQAIDVQGLETKAAGLMQQAESVKQLADTVKQRVEAAVPVVKSAAQAAFYDPTVQAAAKQTAQTAQTLSATLSKLEMFYDKNLAK